MRRVHRFMLTDDLCLCNRELIFWVNRREPVWAIQVRGITLGWKCSLIKSNCMNWVSVPASTQTTSGCLLDRSNAETRCCSLKVDQPEEMSFISLFLRSAPGDGGLNQLLGDDASHISQLQGKDRGHSPHVLFNILLMSYSCLIKGRSLFQVGSYQRRQARDTFLDHTPHTALQERVMQTVLEGWRCSQGFLRGKCTHLNVHFYG